MADEPVETPEAVVESPQVETPAPESVADTPHPLAPGGPRFEEVYRQMKEEREARQRLEAEAAALRQQLQPRAPQQPQFYTPQQLQVAVDQGQITPAVMADILARQHAQQFAMQTTIAAEQMRQQNEKLQRASAEVNQFIDKIPALRDNTSAEFQKVAKVAYEAADDMNLPVTDARVQRRALREVYGSVDRVVQAGQQRQQVRNDSLPHVEGTPARGVSQPTGGKQDDALKNVPKEYIDFWTRKGYSREQMLAEAPYVTRAPRKVAK